MEPKLANGKELTRLLWVAPLNELVKKPNVIEQGFFMFGGVDEAGNSCDDLYWIVPDLKTNKNAISVKNGEYKGIAKPEVKLLAKRLTPEGRGPIARSQHSATFFKN